MPDTLKKVLHYHEVTKHRFERYAQGPGYLDWASQPDPFRRYHGAPLIRLDKVPATVDGPSYDGAFVSGGISPGPMTLQALAQLLFDSLALSAWKSAGGETWALRVNPSSGNLHPTEGYVICGPLAGLSPEAGIYHYAPKEHALELRATLPGELWAKLIRGWPEGTTLLGLTTVHWREAWKYGERAYRYCQLDVGHALAAVSVAAAGLGRQARLIEALSTDQLARLLGLSGPQESEREEPDALIAIVPKVQGTAPPPAPTDDVFQAFPTLSWQGKPNQLSRSHRDWPIIDEVANATQKPKTQSGDAPPEFTPSAPDRPVENRSLSLRRIVHQRRSAVAMDGVTSMPRSAFYPMLLKLTAGSERIPYDTLPWPPQVHLALLVHRVTGLAPGLYFLVRDPQQKAELRRAMNEAFLWEKPQACPEGLELYLLHAGDVQKLAMQISCFQDIAGDGCFSVAMLAAFDRPLNHYGAWFYPRLYWECGMIGQVLYLEAEAAGLRGTGIGCFFDDATHRVLGLRDTRYQDLYHFTVGGPIEDPRLSTLPAYPDV